MTTTETLPDYLESYRFAQVVWALWIGYPELREGLAESSSEILALENMLTEQYSLHPRQAAYTARIALDSVEDFDIKA